MTAFLEAVPLPLRVLLGLLGAIGFIWLAACVTRDIGRHP